MLLPFGKTTLFKQNYLLGASLEVEILDMIFEIT